MEKSNLPREELLLSFVTTRHSILKIMHENERGLSKKTAGLWGNSKEEFLKAYNDGKGVGAIENLALVYKAQSAS